MLPNWVSGYVRLQRTYGLLWPAAPPPFVVHSKRHTPWAHANIAAQPPLPLAARALASNVVSLRAKFEFELRVALLCHL